MIGSKKLHKALVNFGVVKLIEVEIIALLSAFIDVLLFIFVIFKIANKRNLNSVIISACKDKKELESYISCLDTNNLKEFKSFDIIYEINPL